LIAGVSVAAATLGVAGAHADGRVCYEAHAVVAGQDAVDQSGCQDIPTTPPSLPDVPPTP
jgi:hypothetical protein